MPIRVVIVDDEKPARDRIRRLLAGHDDFVVAGEAADASSAIALVDRERPDLCFLDVKMPGGDGFEVLRRVKNLPRLIFTTAFDQYAVRAFEVKSLDYLLKPIDRQRFATALDRAREAMGEKPPSGESILQILEEIRAALPKAPPSPAADPGHAAAPVGPDGGARIERLAGRRAGKVFILEMTDVLWFEAEVTLVFARTPEGRFLVGKTLTELEAELDPSAFFRSHRRYIVNLAHVGEILPAEEGNYRIAMKDEAKSSVPLSRRQARRLRALIPW